MWSFKSHLYVFEMIALSLLCARQKLYAALSVKNSLDMPFSDTLLSFLNNVICNHVLTTQWSIPMDFTSKGICSGQTFSRRRCIFMDLSLGTPLPRLFLFENVWFNIDPPLQEKIMRSDWKSVESVKVLYIRNGFHDRIWNSGRFIWEISTITRAFCTSFYKRLTYHNIFGKSGTNQSSKPTRIQRNDIKNLFVINCAFSKPPKSACNLSRRSYDQLCYHKTLMKQK